MTSGIYVIENTINGKKYVGQSISLERRIRENHDECLALYGAICKYGIENFQINIIEECHELELNEREIYYIELLESHVTKNGYNITFGGSGVMRNRNHSQETKEKLSKKLSGRTLSKEHVHNASMGAQGAFRERESKYVGVSFLEGHNSYTSQININKEHIYLGCYETEEDAARAYDTAAIFYYGENANLNFPENREQIISFLSDKTKLDVKNYEYKTKRKIEGTLFRVKRKGLQYEYKGISNKGNGSKRRKFWATKITIDKETISLGVFETDIHAAIAYDVAMLFFHIDISMEFLNFPERRENYISYLQQYDIQNIKDLRQVIKNYINELERSEQ